MNNDTLGLEKRLVFPMKDEHYKRDHWELGMDWNFTGRTLIGLRLYANVVKVM